jgi:hypothetical protein
MAALSFGLNVRSQVADFIFDFVRSNALALRRGFVAARKFGRVLRRSG